MGWSSTGLVRSARFHCHRFRLRTLRPRSRPDQTSRRCTASERASASHVAWLQRGIRAGSRRSDRNAAWGRSRHPHQSPRTHTSLGQPPSILTGRLPSTFTTRSHGVPHVPQRPSATMASRMSLPHPGRTPSPILHDCPPRRLGPLIHSCPHPDSAPSRATRTAPLRRHFWASAHLPADVLIVRSWWLDLPIAHSSGHSQ
jgi:hypothetical protein